jgi:ADP-ribose pyrophosphatase YjhB (NUDIX family)
MSEPTPSPALVTLVYARRPDGSVLLVERRRPPFAGYWVAPGAELAAHEAPQRGAVRGLMEETGLTALDLRLRGVVRETSPHPDFQWMLFLYRCRAGGTPRAGGAVDDLRWWTQAELERAPVPAADRWWLPHVLGDAPGVLEATLHYDEHRQLGRIETDAPLYAKSA